MRLSAPPRRRTSAPVAGPASAEDFRDPEDLSEVTNQLAAAAVQVFGVKDSVRTFSPDGRVEVVEEKVSRDGEETVITLASDIFFEPEKADLPPTGPTTSPSLSRTCRRA